MTPAEVEAVDKQLKLNGRIGSGKWVDQARALLAG